MKVAVSALLISMGLIFTVPSDMAKAIIFVVAGIVTYLAWPKKRAEPRIAPLSAANSNEVNTEHEPIDGHQYRKHLAAIADPMNTAYAHAPGVSITERR